MRTYAANAYCQRFAESLAHLSPAVVVGRPAISRFPNGEMHAIVRDDVIGQDCVVIGSVAPPDEQLLALLMLASALKRCGTRSVTAFLPYLAYARQDKPGPGESGGIALIGSLLKVTGIQEIITIDVHSRLDEQLIGVPLVSLPSTAIFAAPIRELGWEDVTLVAPDEGARVRAQAVADEVRVQRPIVYLAKRHIDGVEHIDFVGETSSQAVIIDDILDSGRTLISACKQLRDRGVRDIAIAVSHGVFTGTNWQQLFDLGVQKVFVSDTCPEATRQTRQGIQIIPITPLLQDVARALTRKEQRHANINP